MIPVYTGKQVREIDRLAIEEEQIPSLDLMEAAGRGAFEYLETVCSRLKQAKVLILCGKRRWFRSGSLSASGMDRNQGCEHRTA